MTLDDEAASDQAAAGLAALVVAAAEGQWQAETAIDWDQPVRPPRWLPGRLYAGAISQLRFGEIATGRLCQRLAPRLPDGDARTLLALQAGDEHRHGAAYERYLARLGETTPPDPAVAAVFAESLAWNGPPEGLVIAGHVVLEREALGLLRDLGQWCPCPLLRRLNARIARDEARHIAFGEIYLRPRIAALAAEERIAIYRWVKKLWRDCAGATAARYLGTRALVRRRLDERWQQRARVLIRLGLVSAAEAAAA